MLWYRLAPFILGQALTLPRGLRFQGHPVVGRFISRGCRTEDPDSSLAVNQRLRSAPYGPAFLLRWPLHLRAAPHTELPSCFVSDFPFCHQLENASASKGCVSTCHLSRALSPGSDDSESQGSEGSSLGGCFRSSVSHSCCPHLCIIFYPLLGPFN